MHKEFFTLNQECHIKKVSNCSKNHFFGFHDLCPWDEDEEFILAIQTDLIHRAPTYSDYATIGIIDLKNNNSFIPLAETSAWNFQQGSRQQWIPIKDKKIIYNDRISGKLKSILLDINTKEKEIFNFPIYSVHPDGNFAFGVNFDRLQKTGGYGYSSPEKDLKFDHIPENDGIFKIDFSNGKVELVIPISQVISSMKDNIDNTENHYLTHITFNSSGNRICFIHRYWTKDGGAPNRLISSNIDGSDMYVYPITVTHFNWLNDNQIIAFGRNRPLMAKIRQKNIFSFPLFKPILNLVRNTRSHLRQHIVGERYFLLNDKKKESRTLGLGVLTNDGHPMASPDKKFFVTDTYANSNHFRELMLFNIEENQKINVGKFFSLPNITEAIGNDWDNSAMRADLHPRWNRKGSMICIDSVHNGTRQIYTIDVSKLTNT